MAFLDNALFSYRRLNLLGLSLSGSGLAYMSIVLAPTLTGIACGLCHIAEISLLGLSVVFGLAFLLNPWIIGQRIYAICALLLASSGMAVALRYHWLSSSLSPNQCSLGLDTWSHSLPLNLLPLKVDLFDFLPKGTDCIPSDWQFYGLNLIDVAMLLFFILILISGRLLLRCPPDRQTYS